MRRLRCTAGVVASLAVAAGCGGSGTPVARTGTTAAAPAAPTTWIDRGARLSTRVPHGWHVTGHPLTAVGMPTQRLVVSSFAIRQPKPDPGCSPVTARRQMPPDGAMVMVIEYRGPTSAQLARTPARPARFRLDTRALGAYECLGRSYRFLFRDHRRMLQAHVYVGRRATAATRREVVAVLDRLRVGPPDPRFAAVWRPPAEVLARTPYLGVACAKANAIACDRVGLAVWLRHPSQAVEATVDGRALRLDDAAWSGAATPSGRRRMFAGFLQPAGLLDGPLKVTPDAGPHRWIGRRPVHAGVGLLVRRDGGRYVRTSLVVPLAPGWG